MTFNKSTFDEQLKQCCNVPVFVATGKSDGKLDFKKQNVGSDGMGILNFEMFLKCPPKKLYRYTQPAIYERACFSRTPSTIN